MTKICNECRHNIFNENRMKDVCYRPTGGVNLVTGALNRSSISCEVERMTGFILSRIINRCGKEGRFYEEKYHA